MIVKVGLDVYVDSSKHPVIVMFDDDELEQIKNFEPGQNVIYGYPIDANPEQIKTWVEERINQPPFPEGSED